MRWTCPLYPQERTFSEAAYMSAKCQKRTSTVRDRLAHPQVFFLKLLDPDELDLSLGHRTLAASDNTLPLSRRTDGSHSPCWCPANAERLPDAAWKQSLRAYVSYRPTLVLLRAKTHTSNWTTSVGVAHHPPPPRIGPLSDGIRTKVATRREPIARRAILGHTGSAGRVPHGKSRPIC